MMAGDLKCPVCYDIFKDPVILTCSHSFCETCIKHCWETKVTQECPVCRAISQGEPLRNLTLKNLCESTLVLNETDHVLRCSLHKERLTLFCKTDQQLACLVCQQAEQHARHHFSPIEEAVAEQRAKVEKELQSMRNKLGAFERAKTTSEDIYENIKTQAQNTERQIKLKFEKLRQFLQDEEATRIAALKEEEEQKSQIMKEKIEKINREISFLSERIKDIERNIEADDISFLRDCKATMERAKCSMQDPEVLTGTLINVADHLLTHQLWEKMQSLVNFTKTMQSSTCSVENMLYTPVTLDPNTANPHLVVSEDLTSVTYQQHPQSLPDNSERFDHDPCVLGAKSLSSGVHWWDVEVGEGKYWEVGVMEESGQRKGEPDRYETKRWIICRSDDQFVARSGRVYGLSWLLGQYNFSVDVLYIPKKVRVQLNLERGYVLFTDPDKKRVIRKFYLHVTKRVSSYFPYFRTDTTLTISASEMNKKGQPK